MRSAAVDRRRRRPGGAGRGRETRGRAVDAPPAAGPATCSAPAQLSLHRWWSGGGTVRPTELYIVMSPAVGGH